MLDACIGTEGMTTKSITHHRDSFWRNMISITRGDQLPYRLRSYRDRNFHPHRITYQPGYFAGIFHIGWSIEALLFVVWLFHQFDEPASHHRAVVPGIEYFA